MKGKSLGFDTIQGDTKPDVCYDRAEHPKIGVERVIARFSRRKGLHVTILR